MIQRNRFGRSGLKVSPLSFGTMTLGDGADEKTSFALLDLAFERGVNFLDCANMYNGGEAERILGRWINKRGHYDDLIVSTKVRYRVGGDATSEGLSPATIEREIDRSLKRLALDAVDIYFLHQPDYDTPLETTWYCLDRLARAGKIRTVGLSNFAAWQIVEADRLAAANGWIRPTIAQCMYNVLTRATETELFPMARSYDLGVCNYNPLAGGLLTGKYGIGTSETEGRLTRNDHYRRRYFDNRQRQAAQAIGELAVESGRRPVELAIRYCLDHDAISSVILGANTPKQLGESLDAMDAQSLSDHERERADAIYNQLAGPIPAYNR
ncbi:MAG: aldo/keto reductase [marine bacterium B5-7]|nr:MAG: aldo/keto reductase [marine bacterium B5-7]